MNRLPLVLVARRLLPAGLERLAADCEIREGGLGATDRSLLELAPGVEAIIADPTVAVGELLLQAAGPQLRIVANLGVGYDNIDLEACRGRGVMVTDTPGVLTNATAELALALTLSAARRTTEVEAELRAGRWVSSDPGAYLGIELTGASFGIIGMGRIGRRYAELVGGLAGEIVYTSRTRKVDAEREVGAVQVALQEVFHRADVISLHLPARRETAGLVGRDELRAMKHTAILVNTAGGSLVDTAALAEELSQGSIGGVGLDLDVYEPDVSGRLFGIPRCVLLPHIGSATVRAREAMACLAADNVLAALRGAAPPDRVV